MLQNLLWLEVALKLTGGLTLALIPVTASRLVGLPISGTAFWPRLLGAVLIGLALATLLQGDTLLKGAFTHGRGLGLAGSIAINLTSAAILTAQLVMTRAAATRRGNGALWALVAVLTGLSLFELAYV
jgi:hypothetical protein